MSQNPTMYQRLRAFLNRAVKGPNTDALLNAIAVGDQFNADNILAMKSNLLLATAEGRYLEKLMAGIGVTKPPGVGIDDESFRTLGITSTYTKLVPNIFLQLMFFHLILVVRDKILGDGELILQGLYLIH